MDESNGSLEASGTEPEVTLVEVEPGVAVLFGEVVPQGWDVEPFGLGGRADGQIIDALSTVIASSNLAASLQAASASAQGLVRLAPETLRQLQTMEPIYKDGFYLGTLRQGGKFSASVRWVPVAAVQSQDVLDRLGSAASLLSISVQLTQISRKVDENLALTRDVLEALHQDHWDRLRGLCTTIASAVEEARHIGTVTPRIFERVRGLEVALTVERRNFSGFVDRHLQALDADYAERRDYLRRNAERIVADIQGFLMAEMAYCRYQMLRAAEIAAAEHRSAGDDQLMERLAATVPAERRESLRRMAEILQQLDAQCHLATETTGRGWNPRDLFSRGSSSIDDIVRSMAAFVAQLRGVLYDEPVELRPAIEAMDGDKGRDKALTILRWALPPDVPLLALAEVAHNRPGRTPCYLGVTPTRFFLTSRASLTRDGVIDDMMLLDDVRYVRMRREKKSAVLDIITKDANISVSSEVTPDSPQDDALRRVADLLMSAANLPDEERRSAPELEEITSRRQLLPAAVEPAADQE